MDVGVAAQPVDVNMALLLALAFGAAPLFIGLTNSILSVRYRDSSKTLIAGVAFGITIISIWDLFQGASGLGLSLGPESINIQSLLLLAFGIGLFVPFVVERTSRSISSSETHFTSYAVAYAFAMIV
ncbi:MAG: vacuolar-type H+-ATPase subunit I/STV1, partial [Candidatus Nitrosomirales archaeon]